MERGVPRDMARRLRRGLWRVLFGTSVALAGDALPAEAQLDWRLTIVGPITFPIPTVASYDVGAVESSSVLGYTVNHLLLGNATVSIRATSASLGEGKPLSDLQWRRVGTSSWNTMTQGFVNVESRTVAAGSWSGGVEFRILLDWEDDPPGTHSAPLEVRVTFSLL